MAKKKWHWKWKYIPLMPLGFLLALLWAILRLCGIHLAGTVGLVFVGLCLIALIFEFYRSGDIGLKGFALDLLFAQLAFAIVLVTITTIAMRKGGDFGAIDAFVTIVIFADAYFSPFNSFRTALRNWAANIGGHGPAEEHEISE